MLGRRRVRSREVDNFDLLIWRAPEGYRARVRDPEGEGVAHADFSHPFSLEDLDRAFQVGEAQRDLKSSRPEKGDSARSIGTALFQKIFTNEILASWLMRLRKAQSAGKSLRLRLH